MAWNFTDAERRALVKLQLRDSKGRWIEMGKGVKWYSPVAKKEVSGTVIGGKGKDALVELTSEPPKNGKPQQVYVKSTDLDVIDSKATIGAPAETAPEAPTEAPEAPAAPATPTPTPVAAEGMSADAINRELGEIETDIEDMNAMSEEEFDEAMDEAEYPITNDAGTELYLRPNKYEGTDDWYVDLLDEEANELGSWDMPTGDNSLAARREMSQKIHEAANATASAPEAEAPVEAPAKPEAPATPEAAPKAPEAPAAPAATDNSQYKPARVEPVNDMAAYDNGDFLVKRLDPEDVEKLPVGTTITNRDENAPQDGNNWVKIAPDQWRDEGDRITDDSSQYRIGERAIIHLPGNEANLYKESDVKEIQDRLKTQMDEAANPEAPVLPEAATPAPEAQQPASDVTTEPPADTRPLHPVKERAANYPDGTRIKSSRSGDEIEKTDGAWHVAGDPSTPVDPKDIDSPVVSNMPAQGAETFEEFTGVDSVGPGDIVRTSSGAQASVLGVREGKLVVAPHNVPEGQAGLRPSVVALDPSKVSGVNRFSGAAPTTPEPTPEAPETQAPAAPATPERRTPVTARRTQRQTPLTVNRGNINLEISDSQGNTVKRGDTVMTNVGQGTVVAVRPSDGPGGSVKVEMEDGKIRTFRNNKITNAANASTGTGDDPASMEIGSGGTAADGRSFIVGKDNKPVFKGDKVVLADGSEGIVSGIYPNLKSINIKVNGSKTAIRKRASTVDAVDYVAPDAPATPEAPQTPAAPAMPEYHDIRQEFNGDFASFFLEETADAFSYEQGEALRETFAQFTRNVSDKLPNGAKAKITNLGWSGTIMSFDVAFEDKDGNNIGRAERWIKPKLDMTTGKHVLMVEHELFVMKPNARGMGVSTAFLAQSENLYKQLGVSQIGVHANIDVGGYAWARAGFNWDGVSSARAMTGYAKMRVDATMGRSSEWAKNFTPEDIAEFEELRKRVTQGDWEAGTMPTPFQFSQIGADRGSDFGKQIMLNSDWYGVKKLD